MKRFSDEQDGKTYLSLFFRGEFAIAYSVVYYWSSKGLDSFCRKFKIGSPGPYASQLKVPASDIFPNGLTFRRVGLDRLPDGSVNPSSWSLTEEKGHVVLPGEIEEHHRALEEEERKMISRITAQLQVKNSSANTPSKGGSTEGGEISDVSANAYYHLINKMIRAFELFIYLGEAAEDLDLVPPFIAKLHEIPQSFERMDVDKLTQALYIIYTLISMGMTLKEFDISELEALWEKYFPEFKLGIIFNDYVKMRVFFQKCASHLKDTGSLDTFKENFKSLFVRKFDFWEKTINDIHGYLFPKQMEAELIIKAFTIGFYNRKYIMALMHYLAYIKTRFDTFCHYFRECDGDFDLSNANSDEAKLILGLRRKRAGIIANAAFKLACNYYKETDDNLLQLVSDKKEYFFAESETFDPYVIPTLNDEEFYKSVLIYDADILDIEGDDDDDDDFRVTGTELSKQFTKLLMHLLNSIGSELYMKGPHGIKKVVE
jgi:hypothetical protein